MLSKLPTNRRFDRLALSLLGLALCLALSLPQRAEAQRDNGEDARFTPSTIQLEAAADPANGAPPARRATRADVRSRRDARLVRSAVRGGDGKPCDGCGNEDGLFLVDFDASGDRTPEDLLADESFGFDLDTRGGLPVWDIDFPCTNTYGRAQWTLSVYGQRGPRQTGYNTIRGQCSRLPGPSATYLWGTIASICARRNRIEAVLDTAPAALAYQLAGHDLEMVGYRLIYDVRKQTGTLEPIRWLPLPDASCGSANISALR